MEQNKQLAIPRFGEPSVLQLQQQNMPKAASNEVLIEVAFAGVNPIDAKTRAGLGWAAEQNKDKLPWVPGYDIAGTVVASGSDARRFQVGDKVSGFIGFPLQGGGYSQFVVVDENVLSAVPEGVALDVAAGLPLAGQTAWQALEKGKLTVGETVLILAGAGGVGHIAIQLAVAKGATVYASCSAHNRDFVASLGATPLDYNAGALKEQLEPVDFLLDLMGGEVGIAALGCVKAGGRVVTIPTITADKVCQAASEKQLEACGMLVAPEPAQNDTMLAMITEGRLNVHISAHYALEQGEKAHQQIESGRTRGKLVLSV